MKDLNLDAKKYAPRAVAALISQAKNELLGPADYLNQSKDHFQEIVAQVFAIYQKRLSGANSMDFDDLIAKTVEVMQRHPEVRAKYRSRFKHILVDEYQDTNHAQYKLTRLLAQNAKNICVVGDDAQSIYSFRGATIENILQFQKDYDDVKVVKLEQNYRSSQQILKVANQVIKNNKGQIPKNLWTENQEGEKIKLVRTLTDNEEGKFVADTIQEQKLRNHYYNKDLPFSTEPMHRAVLLKKV